MVVEVDFLVVRNKITMKVIKAEVIKGSEMSVTYPRELYATASMEELREVASAHQRINKDIAERIFFGKDFYIECRDPESLPSIGDVLVKIERKQITIK